MHPRLSVHQMCFADAGPAAFVRQCHELGASRISLNGPALLAPGVPGSVRAALSDTGMTVESIAQPFHAGALSAPKRELDAAGDNLCRLIDAAAEVGARSIYLLSGGHGGLAWEHAADRFAAAIAPCLASAKTAGVRLAVENASSLYADLHIAHTLADALLLAEHADIGVCIELFFCWGEAKLPALFARAMPRCVLVQVSDYVGGDRSLPARAVPGDGVIPLAQLIGWLLDAGYSGAFDLELLGPRIAAEGNAAAVARAAAHVGRLLDAVTT